MFVYLQYDVLPVFNVGNSCVSKLMKCVCVRVDVRACVCIRVFVYLQYDACFLVAENL